MESEIHAEARVHELIQHDAWEMPGKCLTGFSASSARRGEFWIYQNSYEKSNILTGLLNGLVAIDANALT